MTELQITIRFLDGRFHGRGDGGVPEWPPSPMRLFQALLAAGKARWSDDVASAFRWLERQPPPVIRAPFYKTGSLRRTFVPNNNTDSPGQLRTDKPIQPTIMLGRPVVQYRWPVAEDEQSHAQHMAEVAGRLRALGWGIDLAIGHGDMLTAHITDDHGQAVDWYPLQTGRVDVATWLRIPAPGSLASLEQAYRESLERVQPDGTLHDNPGQIVYLQTGYHHASFRPAVAFALQRADDVDAARAVRPNQLKSLVAMIRRAASSDDVAEALGPDGQTIINRVILGHPPKTPGPRLSILPLPSIGHRHSDGRIRRVLLTEPFGSDGHVIQVLGELLQGHSLQPEDPADDLGISLVRIQRYDPVVECYIGSTRTWSSATPVLLPGYDDRKQHRGDQQKRFARAEQLVCKALRQADIEQPADIAITRVPLIPGTNHVRDARPRQKLAHYPRYHVRLTFNQSFTGPLSIGAGRHAGFGVMASIT